MALFLAHWRAPKIIGPQVLEGHVRPQIAIFHDGCNVVEDKLAAQGVPVYDQADEKKTRVDETPPAVQNGSFEALDIFIGVATAAAAMVSCRQGRVFFHVDVVVVQVFVTAASRAAMLSHGIETAVAQRREALLDVNSVAS